MDPRWLLLSVALKYRISEPAIEDAFERFSVLSGSALDYCKFRDALSECLLGGLIREPIRLPEGALQCHWCLELTPVGVAAAKAGIALEASDAGVINHHASV